MTAGTPVDVRRSADRFRTGAGGIDTRHSFSFGAHYDPANLGFGMLVAHNEEVVAPGTGYATHPHRDLEIVTWVLSGRLRHTDSAGTTGTVHPGLAQRLGAGSGVLHSESAEGDEPVHFVQMWVRPAETGLAPAYSQSELGGALDTGELVPVASGALTDAAIRIEQPGASLYAARIRPGVAVALAGAAYTHLFVATGTVVLEGVGELAAGDAARLTGDDGRAVTGGGFGGGEVLVWTFGAQ